MCRLVCGVFLDIEMSLRLLFWSSDECLAFVSGLPNLHLSKLFSRFLLESLFKIRIKVIKHILVFDAKISQAFLKCLLSVPITFSLGLSRIGLLDIKSKRIVKFLIIRINLSHECIDIPSISCGSNFILVDLLRLQEQCLLLSLMLAF